MIKSFLTFLIAVTFISAATYAQTNFIPGKIITLAKDTISGSIDYQNWERNPEFIRYKSNGSNEIQKYAPVEISGFIVNEEYYKSQILDVDVTPYSGRGGTTDNLLTTSELFFEKDTVFLEVLARGSMNLYYLYDRFSKHHFFLQNDTIEYEELINHQYLIDKWTLKNDKKYLGQLSYYLSSCKEAQKSSSKVSYTRASMTNIISKFNGCYSSGQTGYNKEIQKVGLAIGVVGGLSLSNFRFSSDHPSYNILDIADLGFAPGVSFGGVLNLVSQRNRRRSAFSTELIYKSYSKKIHHVSGLTNTDISLNFSFINFNTAFRYKFIGNKVNPYFTFGLSYIFTVKNDNTERIERTSSTTPLVTESEAISSVRGGRFGGLMGIGGEVGRYAFEFRYTTATGLSNLVQLSSSERSFNILLTYYLKRTD